MKPEVELTGIDGNAFSILGRCKKAAKKAGWSKEHIDELVNEMTSSDYNYLLWTVKANFEVD